MDLNDEDIEFDVDDFEAEFAAAMKKKEEVKEAKPSKVTLLPTKQAQQLHMALKMCKQYSMADIQEAALTLNESVLTEDRLQVLINSAPGDMEFKIVQKYTGEEAELDAPELYVRAVQAIPDYKSRLELLSFLNNYKSLLEDAEQRVKVFEQSMHHIKTSGNFRRVLEIVLALGNYLNGGTKKGEQYGFKLSTITQLKNTKAQTKDKSLMNFIVEQVQSRHPEAEGFLEEFADMEFAAKLQSAFVNGEIRQLDGKIKKMKMLLDKEKVDPRCGIEEKFKAFYAANKDVGVQLIKRMDAIVLQTKEVAQLYAENPASTKAEDLFKIFAEFTNDYKFTKQSMIKKAEMLAAAQKREAAREMRKLELAEKRANGDGEFAPPDNDIMRHPSHSMDQVYLRDGDVIMNNSCLLVVFSCCCYLFFFAVLLACFSSRFKMYC